MASSSLSTLILLLLLALISPSLSSKCKPHKFSHNRVFENCLKLPTLHANLHWTYINSSLSIAFTAPPPNSNGWISWAINPTGTGMGGAQALIAFKDPKLDSMIVQTFNISSYKSIEPSKIAFNVSNMSAEKFGKHMKILATLFLPENMTTINQVWQIGSVVDSNGIPQKHEMAPANLNSKGELNLLGDDISPAPQPSPGSLPAAPAPTGKKNGGVSMMKIGNGYLRVILFLYSIFLIVI